MKKLILLLTLITLPVINGCLKSIDTEGINAEAGKIISVATKLNDLTGVLMRQVGPLAVAGICTVQPQDCPPAQIAYTMALQAQALYAKGLEDAKAANEAPDGLKLSVLAQNFQARYAELAKILGTGDASKLGEFQDKLKELEQISQTNGATK